MADFAGSKAKITCKPPFGGHPGVLIFTITLTAATYVNGNLNLSSIKIPGGITPKMVTHINFSVNATAAYMPTYAPAATPTWANLGTLKLYTATGTEATGTLTFTLTGCAQLTTLPDIA